MRKGQAALEFLTTYGWAFLVILVMIGALAYFGILSPSRFLPERCNVGPEFTCNEYKVTNSDGRVTIKFTNNVGETISNVVVTSCGWAQQKLTTPPVTGNPPTNNQYNVTYQSGGSARGGDWIQVICDFDNAGASAFPPTGQKMKFNIDITYIPQGNTYTKPLAAEVYSALQP